MDGQQFDINKKESMDLLEYITIYSNKYFPGFDPDTGEQTNEEKSSQFALRYNNSIGNKFTKDDYLRFRKIQSTLKAYQLDRDKFWYFLLFIYDYSLCAGNGIHRLASPIEELEELFKAIDNNLEITNGLGFFGWGDR